MSLNWIHLNILFLILSLVFIQSVLSTINCLRCIIFYELNFIFPPSGLKNESFEVIYTFLSLFHFQSFLILGGKKKKKPTMILIIPNIIARIKIYYVPRHYSRYSVSFELVNPHHSLEKNFFDAILPNHTMPNCMIK